MHVIGTLIGSLLVIYRWIVEKIIFLDNIESLRYYESSFLLVPPNHLINEQK